MEAGREGRQMVNGKAFHRLGIAASVLALMAMACALPLPKRNAAIIASPATLPTLTARPTVTVKPSPTVAMSELPIVGCWNIRTGAGDEFASVAQVCDTTLIVTNLATWSRLGGQYDGLYICIRAFGVDDDC